MDQNLGRGERIKEGIFRMLLFISSYIPLFIIIYIKNVDSLKVAIFISCILVIIPLIVIRIYIQTPLKHEANVDLKILSSKSQYNEMLGYISGYIIPFIAFNQDVVTKEGISIRELIIVFILFAVMCNLYMRANMYYINPVIGLFYDVYAIETASEEEVLIARKGIELPINRRIVVRRISPHTYLHVDNEVRRSKISWLVILLLCVVLLIFLISWNKQVQDSINILMNWIKIRLKM